jgi:hypothetical protein
MRREHVIALFVASVIWNAGCHHDGGDHGGEQAKVAMQVPKDPPKRPQGSPALTVKPGPEPFSKQDVVTYFKTHNLPMNATNTSDFSVASLEFMTDKELTARLSGVSTGLAETDKIGFVTLTGLFIFTGPPNAKPVRFSSAYAAFDAASGNLMMIGTLELGQQQPR